MRSLLVVCLVASVASADPTIPSDAAFKGKDGDWTHFEVERAVLDGTESTHAVAILASSLKARIAWTVGDATREEPWEMERVHALLRELAKDKATKRAPTPCKLGPGATCTKLTYLGEVTSFGMTNKVAVNATLSDKVSGSGIVALEVRIDDKPSWQIKAVGYGNGAKATWGTVPWRTTAGAVGAPPAASTQGLAQSFIDLRPETGPLVAVVSTANLDKAIVRRYLKRNLQKLIYCYEKQQLAKPTLAGSVDFRFIIGVDGKVSESTAKGIDPEVERCASGVVKSIEFPLSRDKQPVDVTFTMHYQIPKPPPGKKI